jgi:hypothetical protein
LCDGTIEHADYERLTSKEQAAQALLADNVPMAMTREVMLAELLAIVRDTEMSRPSAVAAHR